MSKPCSMSPHMHLSSTRESQREALRCDYLLYKTLSLNLMDLSITIIKLRVRKATLPQESWNELRKTIQLNNNNWNNILFLLYLSVCVCVYLIINELIDNLNEVNLSYIYINSFCRLSYFICMVLRKAKHVRPLQTPLWVSGNLTYQPPAVRCSVLVVDVGISISNSIFVSCQHGPSSQGSDPSTYSSAMSFMRGNSTGNGRDSRSQCQASREKSACAV